MRTAELRAARIAFVTATVVRAERPTSAKAGDSAVVLADGTIEGFVGGACAESSVRLHALACLRTGDPVLLRITPDTGVATADPVGQLTVANPCLSGGTLEVFLAPAIPDPLVLVVGAGPIAAALAAAGPALGFDVRLGDTLPDPLPADLDAVVVASHGRGEEAALRAALGAGVRYVGLVASRRRGPTVLAELGLCGSHTSRVHTPAGLDIGARRPAEVALAILAEIVATRPREDWTAPPAAPVTGATAVDPVCGMSVAMVAASLHVEHAGTTVWFCGSGCRDAFVAAPGAYVTPTPGGV